LHPVATVQYQKTKQPQHLMRVGECNNCGICCNLYDFNLGIYRLCEKFDGTKEKHCMIWNKRPKMCKEYPRGPMDIINKPECSYEFFDENGRKYDCYMDERVRLTIVGNLPEEYPFSKKF